MDGFAKSAAPLAVAGRDCERPSLRRLVFRRSIRRGFAGSRSRRCSRPSGFPAKIRSAAGCAILLLGYVAGSDFFLDGFFLAHNRHRSSAGSWLALYMAIYFAALELVLRFAAATTPRRTDVSRAANIQWPPPRSLTRSTHRSRCARGSVHRTICASPFVVAAVWVALEWLRGWVFSGWGWNRLGVALHLYRPIIQIAEFTGIAGHFVPGRVCECHRAFAHVRRFILETKVHQMRPHYDLTLTMAAVVGLFAYGFQTMQVRAAGDCTPRRSRASQRAARRKIQFAICLENLRPILASQRTALRANPPPDLLVWPESSMPGPVLEDDRQPSIRDGFRGLRQSRSAARRHRSG